MSIYGFYSGDEYLALPRDQETWVVKPLIPVGGWVNVYGPPKKARKSYFALGLAQAVACGKPSWLGFDILNPGPVLYLQADTPDPLWAQRVRDTKSGGYDFSNVYFASLMTMPYPFNISDHEEILSEMISKVPGDPVMIVFDTGRALHTMDENSSQDMTLFVHALNRVAGHMAKVLITHDKKGLADTKGEPDHAAEQEDLMRGNRGSTSIAGGVDTTIKMTPKGYMYYQGRAVGDAQKKLKFTHVHNADFPCPHEHLADCMGHVWEEDHDDEILQARTLLTKYTNGSERSLARILAKDRNITEEKARAILRKQKEGKIEA